MNTSAHETDERVDTVLFSDNMLIVGLKDGRAISVPLWWYPNLEKAPAKQRSHWEICGGGYGIHWPEIDEDLSTEGLLRGAAAPTKHSTFKPGRQKRRTIPKKRRSLKSSMRTKARTRAGK